MLRDQVSHPYKTTGRIKGLYILTFKFLDRRALQKKLKLQDTLKIRTEYLTS
jgi:hypothetical protein